MGIKLNSNGRRVIAALGALMITSAFLFQNCSPTTLNSDAENLYGPAPTDGDSKYRLPAAFNETLNTGITCSVAVNATTIPVGGALNYTFTTTGVLPAGYRVYSYGTKNGVPDSSEVTPSFFQALTQSYTNPGYIGGNYTRYFQMRDSTGRVLCQTNTVSLTLAGNQCTLTTSTPILKQGFLMILNTAYAAGTTVPVAGTVVQFNGTNNGLTIAPVPYDQTNYTTYQRVMLATDVGNDYIRFITTHNADGSINCMTNSIRIQVLR